MTNASSRKTHGDTIRTVLTDIFNRHQAKVIQLEHLDEAFHGCAEILRRTITRMSLTLTEHKDNPDALVSEIANGGIIYDKISVPVSTNFLQPTNNEILALPGYIKLHEAARELDVAIMDVVGLFDRNVSVDKPYVVFDIRQSYKYGLREKPEVHPDLPDNTPRPPAPDNDTFKF